MGNCTHTDVRQIPNPIKHYVFDPETEPDFIDDIYSTYEDIDLHRTKCTQCGHILYYSGAARSYHEDGIRSPHIIGLE